MRTGYILAAAVAAATLACGCGYAPPATFDAPTAALFIDGRPLDLPPPTLLAPRALPRAIGSYEEMDYHVTVQYIPSCVAGVSGTGLDLNEGSGGGVEWWLRDQGRAGWEGWLGFTRHTPASGGNDVYDFWFRLGWRGVLAGESPFFAYGSVGLSWDFVDSEDFSTLVTDWLSLLPLPLGGYARAGVGSRIGPVVITAEVWVTAGVLLWWEGDRVGLTTAAFAIGVGGVF